MATPNRSHHDGDSQELAVVLVVNVSSLVRRPVVGAGNSTEAEVAFNRALWFSCGVRYTS